MVWGHQRAAGKGTQGIILFQNSSRLRAEPWGVGGAPSLFWGLGPAEGGLSRVTAQAPAGGGHPTESTVRLLSTADSATCGSFAFGQESGSVRGGGLVTHRPPDPRLHAHPQSGTYRSP